MTPLDFSIEGTDLQYVELRLQPGGSAVGEPGSMMFMDDGLTMETVLGDGANEGLLARLAGALKRAFTGESMFSTLFQNPTDRPLRVAFAAPSPGRIMAVDLAANGGSLISQKGAFLAGTQGVRVGLAFKKRLRVGFFGGEGFIMQKLTERARRRHQAAPTTFTWRGRSLRWDRACRAQTTGHDIRYVAPENRFSAARGCFSTPSGPARSEKRRRCSGCRPHISGSLAAAGA